MHIQRKYDLPLLLLLLLLLLLPTTATTTTTKYNIFLFTAPYKSKILLNLSEAFLSAQMSNYVQSWTHWLGQSVAYYFTVLSVLLSRWTGSVMMLTSRRDSAMLLHHYNRAAPVLGDVTDVRAVFDLTYWSQSDVTSETQRAEGEVRTA